MMNYKVPRIPIKLIDNELQPVNFSIIHSNFRNGLEFDLNVVQQIN